MTARDSDVDKQVGLELGADDYVTKPFTWRELAARIRAVLARQPFPSGPAAAEAGLAWRWRRPARTSAGSVSSACLAGEGRHSLSSWLGGCRAGPGEAGLVV